MMTIAEQMANDSALRDFFLLVAKMKAERSINLVEYRMLMEGSRFGEKAASRALSLVNAIQAVQDAGFEVTLKAF